MKIKSIMKKIRNIKESPDDFESQYYSAPPKIKSLIDDAMMEIEDGEDAYKILKQLNSTLNKLGWKIDYGLDGGITDMKKIRNIKESPDDFESQYYSAPPKIKSLIDDAMMEIEDGEDAYKILKQLNSTLNKLGWKIDYGLDGGITDLVKT